MFDYCIILAGGSGTRLWPASTLSRPKQFLSLPHETSPEYASSFFSSAVERALAVISASDDSRVIIISGKNHINHIIQECEKLNPDEKSRLVLIPEPAAKNTAPAIACALLYIEKISMGKGGTVLVLTSDHIIQSLDTFKYDADAAAAIAKTDKLVVFGITPSRPETGYGYIETEKTNDPTETSPDAQYKTEVFSVASFREKPDLENAKLFAASKQFYWNSGMFAFSSNFMLEEFRRSSADVISTFETLPLPTEKSYINKKGLLILENWKNLETAYHQTKAISFDYAIAEKCRSVIMVKAGFSWIDIGSWDEYARLAKKTGAEVYGTPEALETCFVDSDIPVAICGVKDLIIVVRSGKNGGPASVLVSKKGETQNVKAILEDIKASGRMELL